MRPTKTALALTLVALLAASLLAGAATASAPPKPVSSNFVKVSDWSVKLTPEEP